MNSNYDLIVIGAGSGGLAAAERASGYGARVAIVEQSDVGGACINYGCIPEKLLDYAASFDSFNQIATYYGWSDCKRHFDWPQFISAKDRHVEHLNQLHLQHLRDAGVQFFQAEATFLDTHTVLIDNRPITADKILIAVGAKPEKPNISGAEHAITWRELYHLPVQPKQIAIVGSDPIGVKVAGSMNALGSQVTCILPEDQILPHFDADMGKAIQERMNQQGVQFLSNTQVEKIEQNHNCCHLTLSGSRTGTLTVDTVLLDVPRRPNLTKLNLEKAQIQLTASGAIQVDVWSRTTQSHIFAVGDCTGRVPLTPSAIAQAKAFANTEWGGHPNAVDYDWVPISIASHPEAATVGLSEAEAHTKFGEAVHCYRTQFRPLLYCLTQTNEKTLLKVVVNQQDSERILGVHMVGDKAVEIIQTLAIALRLGATKRDLDTAIGIHPSSAEELFSI